MNKKVSCRKQIARQHSCHKNFGQGRDRGRPCIAMQILDAVSDTVCAHVGGPNNSRNAETLPLVAELQETCPSQLCYHSEFDYCRSNHMAGGVRMEIGRKKCVPCIPPIKVTQAHRNRHGFDRLLISYLFLLVILNNHGPF